MSCRYSVQRIAYNVIATGRGQHLRFDVEVSKDLSKEGC